MTKKHFIALADVLRYCRPSKIAKPTGYKHRQECWEGIVEEIAKYCATQNPRFNYERWIAYIHDQCGQNGGKR